MKIVLAKLAHKVERTVEKVRRGPSRDNPIVDCFGGYTTPDAIILRGRVLAKAREISRAGGQSKWRNFKDFLSLFFTDELRDVAVSTTDRFAQTRTDEEGFFALVVPAKGPEVPDTIKLQVEGAQAIHIVPVFSSRAASFGVISDIDDTVLRTGAFSLLRNLWTSATGNVHEREVFEDAVQLLQQFKRDNRCFFYVSSSPWNLYDYLQAIFIRAKLPRGPFFLRDLGISDTQFFTGTHGDHKTDAIEKILAANPDLTFTLVGDTGQHDPHIYADIVQRHDGRIDQVILRRPSAKDLSAQIESDVASIKKAGIEVHMDYDYRNLLTEVTGH